MIEELETRPPQSDCSLVKTYVDKEYPVDIIGNNTKETVYLRVLIMTRNMSLNGISIALTSNNKIFIAHNIQNGKLFVNEELNVYDIIALKQKISILTKQVSELTMTIKELALKAEGHILVGVCNHIALNTNELNGLVADDLEQCFNVEDGRWYYYSQALQSWTRLPINWQKLNRIVRYIGNLTSLDYESDITVGCLENGLVYQIVDSRLVEIAAPVHDIGDEYKIPNKGYVVYTKTGWKFIRIGG